MIDQWCRGVIGQGGTTGGTFWLILCVLRERVGESGRGRKPYLLPATYISLHDQAASCNHRDHRLEHNLFIWFLLVKEAQRVVNVDQWPQLVIFSDIWTVSGTPARDVCRGHTRCIIIAYGLKRVLFGWEHLTCTGRLELAELIKSHLMRSFLRESTFDTTLSRHTSWVLTGHSANAIFHIISRPLSLNLRPTFLGSYYMWTHAAGSMTRFMAP